MGLAALQSALAPSVGAQNGTLTEPCSVMVKKGRLGKSSEIDRELPPVKAFAAPLGLWAHP